MTDTVASPEATPTAVPVTPDASLIAPVEASAPAGPARPDGLPDAYWDDAAGIKPEAYSRLAELEAAEVARREGIPATVADYKLELDEPVVGLDGKPVAFDPEDPLAKALLPALHEAGVPQAGLSRILQAYAAQELADIKAANEEAAAARAAEIKKLGPDEGAVTRRTSATHGLVTAAIGSDQAEALRAVMTNAAAFQALEALVSKLQSPAMSAAPITTPAPASVATRLYG